MRIFITGVTGYIGGAVAVRLAGAGHEVVGLVRDASRVGTLEGLGIQAVVGDLAALDVVGREARAADAVINTASSDDLPFVQAVTAALEGTGKPFIHTSGGFIVADRAKGTRAEPEAFSTDTDVQAGNYKGNISQKRQIAANDAVLAAAGQGVRSMVLCTSLTYGLGAGLKRQSQVIPMMIDLATVNGQAHHFRDGRNLWSHVHIEDLVELYLLLLEKGEAGGFYFAENGEVAFKDLTDEIAAQLGLGESQPWDAEQERGFATFAANFRVRGEQSRALGWQPRHDDVLGSIEAEVELLG